MTYFDAPYRPADLSLNSGAINNSLVGFWPLTDGSGTSAVDVSTGGNNGTQSGGVSWASSEIGTVASFDGSDDRFEVDDAGAFDFGTGNFSVSAWVYFDTINSSYTNIVSRGDTSLGTACWFGIYKNSSTHKFIFDVDDNISKASATSSVSATSGAWFHVVGVRNSGGTNAIYINGVSTGTVSDNGNSISQTGVLNQEFRIGCQRVGGTYQEFHDGNIQNVRIFNAALTAAQVEQLYTRPWTGTNYDTEALWLSPPASPTLSTASESTSIMADIEGWWVMTDGSGTTLTDISGNGRDATLNGTNTWETETLGTVNRFDNSSSSGNNATTAQHQISLSNYTVAFWVKNEDAGLSGAKYGAGVCLTDGAATTSSDVDIYFRRDGTTQWPQLLHNRNNGGTYNYYDLSESNKASQKDVWKFWAITFDGTNAKVYSDASLVGTSGTLAAPLSTTGKHIVINGVQTSSTGLTCSMQNVRLYSRCLSADEITTLYERPWIGAEYNESFYLYPPVPSSLTPLDSSSINTDLEGWWPLTETDNYASGAADISGNGNNGTPQSNAGSANTALGQVLEQPDANSYISVGDVSALKITGALSISIWLKTDSSTPVNIVSKYHATTGGRAYSLHLNRPELEFNINGTIVAQGTTQIRGDDKWHHLVGVYDPSNFVRVYVDGVLDGEVTTGVPSSITDTSYPFNIGRAYNGGNVVGFLQNCRVWSRALSASEVADIYYSPWLGSAYTGTSSDPATNRYFSPAAFARLG